MFVLHDMRFVGKTECTVLTSYAKKNISNYMQKKKEADLINASVFRGNESHDNLCLSIPQTDC